MTLSEAIVFNLQLGLRHWEIWMFLKSEEGINISIAQTKSLGLLRRKAQSDLLQVALFLQEQLNQYGMLHGYKLMHLKCIQAGLVVTQTTIRHLLLLLDPRGVQLRKRNRLRRLLYINPRPNFLWHVDSYDKLKPYGVLMVLSIFPYGHMATCLHHK